MACGVNGASTSSPLSRIDVDEDGVAAEIDCDDSRPYVGRLLYEQEFDTDDQYLMNSPTLSDPWSMEEGAFRNLRGGQQALLGAAEGWSDTVTFARLRGEGLERRCRVCGFIAAEAEGGGHALWLPGLYDGDSSHRVKLTFEGGSEFHYDKEIGEAHLVATARVFHLGGGPGELGERWSVDMRWVYRGKGPEGEGSGGPKRERRLWQSQEVTDQWQYFDLVAGEMRSDSGIARFVQYPTESVYPMQMGWKANNKNDAYGLSSWFSFVHERGEERFEGRGDINIDLHERDRFRAGVLARANEDADQDEGFHGYRCAVARNSAVDCHDPGRFVQIASFLDAEEDDIRSECEEHGATCPANTTFEQLARVERGMGTDVLEGCARGACILGRRGFSCLRV